MGICDVDVLYVYIYIQWEAVVANIGEVEAAIKLAQV